MCFKVYLQHSPSKGPGVIAQDWSLNLQYIGYDNNFSYVHNGLTTWETAKMNAFPQQIMSTTKQNHLKMDQAGIMKQ